MIEATHCFIQPVLDIAVREHVQGNSGIGTDVTLHGIDLPLSWSFVCHMFVQLNESGYTRLGVVDEEVYSPPCAGCPSRPGR